MATYTTVTSSITAETGYVFIMRGSSICCHKVTFPPVTGTRLHRAVVQWYHSCTKFLLQVFKHFKQYFVAGYAVSHSGERSV